MAQTSQCTGEAGEVYQPRRLRPSSVRSVYQFGRAEPSGYHCRPTAPPVVSTERVSARTGGAVRLQSPNRSLDDEVDQAAGNSNFLNNLFAVDRGGDEIARHRCREHFVFARVRGHTDFRFEFPIDLDRDLNT